MDTTLDSKPRLYYGWAMVLALAITETISWGILYYSFSVFIKPMQDDLHWSRGALTGAYSLGLFLSGIVGVVVGRVVDRHGTRLLMTVGSCVAVLFVLAWATAQNEVIFYLIWAGLGAAMAALLYEPAFAVIATWFRKGQRKALTLLTCVAGFASTIFVPLTQWLVTTYGWRSALIFLALLLAGITIPLHAVILRRQPQDLGLLPDGVRLPLTNSSTQPSEIAHLSIPQVIRSQTFLFLATALTLNMLASVGISVHLIPYLTDLHYDAAFAAAIAGLVGAMSLPSRLLYNYAGNRLSHRWVLTSIFLLQTISLFALLAAHDAMSLVGFAILFGAANSALTPARASLVAELYGSARYGSISGVLALFITGARALAPVAVGVLHDSLGTYTPIIGGLICISALATLVITLNNRRFHDTVSILPVERRQADGTTSA